MELLSRQQVVTYVMHPDKPIVFFLLLEPMSQTNRVVASNLLTGTLETNIPLSKSLFGKSSSFQYNHLAYLRKRNLLALALQSKKFLLFDLDNLNRLLIETEFKGKQEPYQLTCLAFSEQSPDIFFCSQHKNNLYAINYNDYSQNQKIRKTKLPPKVQVMQIRAAKQLVFINCSDQVVRVFDCLHQVFLNQIDLSTSPCPAYTQICLLGGALLSVDSSGRLVVLPRLHDHLKTSHHSLEVFSLNKQAITIKPDTQQDNHFIVLCMDGQLCHYRLDEQPTPKIKLISSSYFDLQLDDKFNKRFNISLFVDRHPVLPLLTIMSARSYETNQQFYYASIYHLPSPMTSSTLMTLPAPVPIQSLLLGSHIFPYQFYYIYENKIETAGLINNTKTLVTEIDKLVDGPCLVKRLISVDQKRTTQEKDWLIMEIDQQGTTLHILLEIQKNNCKVVHKEIADDMLVVGQDILVIEQGIWRYYRDGQWTTIQGSKNITPGHTLMYSDSVVLHHHLHCVSLIEIQEKSLKILHTHDTLPHTLLRMHLVSYQKQNVVFMVYAWHVLILDHQLNRLGLVELGGPLSPIKSTCIYGLAIIIQTKHKVFQVDISATSLELLSLPIESTYPQWMQQPLLDKIIFAGGTPFQLATLHFSPFQPLLQGLLAWSSLHNTPIAPDILDQVCKYYLDSQFSKYFFIDLLQKGYLRLAQHLSQQDNNVQLDAQLLVQQAVYSRKWSDLSSLLEKHKHCPLSQPLISRIQSILLRLQGLGVSPSITRPMNQSVHSLLQPNTPLDHSLNISCSSLGFQQKGYQQTVSMYDQEDEQVFLGLVFRPAENLGDHLGMNSTLVANTQQNAPKEVPLTVDEHEPDVDANKDSLRIYWHFDEGKGDLVEDLTDHKIDLLLPENTNDECWVALFDGDPMDFDDKWGKKCPAQFALKFPLDAPARTKKKNWFPSPLSKLTLQLWFKTYQPTLQLIQFGNDSHLVVSILDSQINITHFGESLLLVPQEEYLIEQFTWQHITLCYDHSPQDGPHLLIYLDTRLIATCNSILQDHTFTSCPVVLQQHDAALQGEITEFRLYTDKIDVSQIKDEYRQPLEIVSEKRKLFKMKLKKKSKAIKTDLRALSKGLMMFENQNKAQEATKQRDTPNEPEMLQTTTLQDPKSFTSFFEPTHDPPQNKPISNFSFSNNGSPKQPPKETFDFEFDKQPDQEAPQKQSDKDTTQSWFDFK